jgi:glycosyltransferase involved in cell wall biosynthesis
VKRLRPDIVHGQGVEAGYAWLAVNQPRPSIITLHGVLGFTAQLRTKGVYPRLARTIQWATMRRATDVIAISEAVARWVNAHSQARVHLLPNAVHPSIYSVPPASEAQFDFLYVGRICPEKGLMDAIEALRELDQRGLSVRLGVVGRGSGHSGYLQRCAEVASGLRRSSVTFLGPQPILAVIRRALALILPSYGENFSMAAAEASAAGRPVVAYKSGGVPSVVVHQRTGLLVEPGNVRALADAMAALVSNTALAHSLGHEARKRAAAWHRDRVCQLTAELYRELIFRRSRHSQQTCVADGYGAVS